MADRHVHATHRVLDRRYREAVLGPAGGHECVTLSSMPFTSHQRLPRTHLPLAVWPANLVNCALFNTLHSQVYSGMGNRGGISRERFFLYAFLGSFAWYWFPGYIFQALSVFSWVCWIAPNNVVSIFLLGSMMMHSEWVVVEFVISIENQPAIRILIWDGHVAHHVRLGADRVHRQSTRYSLYVLVIPLTAHLLTIRPSPQGGPKRTSPLASSSSSGSSPPRSTTPTRGTVSTCPSPVAARSIIPAMRTTCQ
jgi:hypothetical protein